MTSGTVNTGSMMKIVPHPTGRSENGISTWVPYTVKQSRIGWVTSARNTSSSQPRQWARVAGWMRTAAHAITGVARASTRNEWL